jgi:HEAT repeat protein
VIIALNEMSQIVIHSRCGRCFAPLALSLVAFAMSAISGCSSRSADKIPKLIEELSDANSDTRYQAIKQLGNHGADARDAVTAMIPLLKDQHSSIRVGTAYAFAKIGPPAAPAVPALIAALEDPNKEVRRGAAYALPELGPDATSAWKALQKVAARDVDPKVRTEATQSMTKIQTIYKYRQAADKVGQTADGHPAK